MTDPSDVPAEDPAAPPPDAGEFPLERVRADTPGADDHIHFNSAGSSLPTRQVLAIQVDYLTEEARRGGYELAEARAEEFDGVYGSLAQLIGASADEIAITSNATESWQLAFHSIHLERGDRIVVGEASYASNFIGLLRRAEQVGVEISVVPSDAMGETTGAAVADAIDARTRLIALTHIPTNGGLINPAADVGAVAREAGVPFLLDACQSVGQIEVDVEALGCDFLSTTGRKFLRGPRGSGFLYVRRAMLESTTPPFLDLHGATWTALDSYEMRPDARRYENWEFNVAAVLGLGAAADYATDLGMATIERRVVALGTAFRDRLADLPTVTVHDIGRRQGGIVTFSSTAVNATSIRAGLADAGIAVTTTTPFSTRLDATRRGIGDMVRASLHYFNTAAEIDTAVDAIGALVR